MWHRQRLGGEISAVTRAGRSDVDHMFQGASSQDKVVFLTASCETNDVEIKCTIIDSREWSKPGKIRVLLLEYLPHQ